MLKLRLLWSRVGIWVRFRHWLYMLAGWTGDVEYYGGMYYAVMQKMCKPRR